MKKLALIDKFIFILNSLFATLLLLSYLSYYISPNTISIFSLISLIIPVLLFINCVFALYWIIRLKKQFLLSIFVLAIGYQYVTKFYSFKDKEIILTDDVRIMSYNVRMFNLYKWINEKNVDEKIYDFINSKEPDILCIQEFHPSLKKGLKYPYEYIKISNENNHFGHAIFSKFKIINSGSLNFSNSVNNAIFADIVKNNDTVRVYNIHMESLNLNPKDDYFTQENSEKFKIRVQNAFKIQANQATLIMEHIQKTTHKSIICGDFNNTAFSWVYHQLLKEKNDAFEVAGKGFGRTFDYKLPVRIDFILVDDQIEVNNFKTYDVKFSDHFPIMARLNF
ncbi:MAG: endonuclease/exonuclease/phosphatase family protein [Flavobacteriaceae bacterium]|nr:endonuclease/exonuclease/phosphatase family protein [Flavobacteriaceae bacterium]